MRECDGDVSCAQNGSDGVACHAAEHVHDGIYGAREGMALQRQTWGKHFAFRCRRHAFAPRCRLSLSPCPSRAWQALGNESMLARVGLAAATGGRRSSCVVGQRGSSAAQWSMLGGRLCSDCNCRICNTKYVFKHAIMRAPAAYKPMHFSRCVHVLPSASAPHCLLSPTSAASRRFRHVVPLPPPVSPCFPPFPSSSLHPKP